MIRLLNNPIYVTLIQGTSKKGRKTILVSQDNRSRILPLSMSPPRSNHKKLFGLREVRTIHKHKKGGN